MPRNWPITVVLSLLLISTGCSTLPDSKSLPPVEEVSPYAAKFRDRAIDLEPFLRGYPFSGVEAELEHGHLLYFESTPEGKWLRFMNVKSGRRVDLAEGRKVGDIDWATRSWWSSKYHPATGKFYISSDEANDEHTNIYALDLEEGKTERITDNDYTYAWGFSDDGELLGYVRRTGLKEPMVGCFRVRDMLTGQDREILCDAGGADRFTWSKVLFTPDNRSVILTIQHDGNRRTKSLARIDLYSSDIEYLIPPRVERFGVELMEGWIGEHEFLYRSSEEGYENIYHYDLRIRKSTRLTDIHDRLRNARLLDTDPPVIMAMLRRPHESEAQLIDARSGEVLASEIIDSWVKIVDTDGSSGIFSVTDLTKPFSLEWFSALRRDGEWRIERQAMAAMPAELKEKIVHVEPERVSYPTFDTLPDSTPRMLHAFYLEPTRPPTDPADRLVLITAFYGGGNYYSEKTNILAAAGIASFSPAPRGSHDFGAEFAALNDGDLGGDEIIDIIYAARWLVEHKGYKPHQIGVHGGSHGGYATMRCLTFPPKTNGRGESFDFGFGHSHAGFSDIASFYDTCNIPDWVIQEAGDPATERDKLFDRSPIAHVDRLQAPILLTHGENDWRVPVAQSRRFVDKARAFGKVVAYVEFPGQGHGIDGLENNLAYYQVLFDFYESLDVGSERGGGSR